MKKLVALFATLLAASVALAQNETSTQIPAASTDANSTENTTVTQTVPFREVGPGQTALQLTPGSTHHKTEYGFATEPFIGTFSATNRIDSNYLNLEGEQGLTNGFAVGAKLGFLSGNSSTSFSNSNISAAPIDQSGLKDIILTGKWLKNLNSRTSVFAQADLGISPVHSVFTDNSDGSTPKTNGFSGGQSLTPTVAIQTKVKNNVIVGGFAQESLKADRVQDFNTKNTLSGGGVVTSTFTSTSSGQSEFVVGANTELQANQAAAGLKLDSRWIGEGSSTSSGSSNTTTELPTQFYESTVYISIRAPQYEIIPSFTYTALNDTGHFHIDQQSSTDVNLGMRFVF